MEISMKKFDQFFEKFIESLFPMKREIIFRIIFENG